jgi:hypothetical protein
LSSDWGGAYNSHSAQENYLPALNSPTATKMAFWLNENGSHLAASHLIKSIMFWLLSDIAPKRVNAD